MSPFCTGKKQKQIAAVALTRPATQLSCILSIALSFDHDKLRSIMASTTKIPGEKPLPALKKRLLQLTLFIAIPLILIGITEFIDAFHVSYGLILQQNLTLAEAGAIMVEDWLRGHINTLKAIESATEFQTFEPENIPPSLIERYLRSQPDWEDLSISDEKGTIVVTTLPK
jgi:hypothetical protein